MKIDAGHYTLSGAEMELMNKSLQKLMEYALYGGEQEGLQYDA